MVPDPLQALTALQAKADAFFDRVAARHGDRMACAPGCDACCRQSLTVTAVEAAALALELGRLPAPTRARLLTRLAAPAPNRCVALEEDGRCSVYPARPLVCRTHGAPIRLRPDRGLPVVQACHLNFTDDGPEAADPDCVLDQTTLSTLLAAVEAAFARARGGTPVRRPLAEVLAEAFGDERPA